MAETTNEENKAPEVTDETPITPETETQSEETKTDESKADEPKADKPKTTRKSRTKKQVNLDEDMDKVHPTFATGIQAVMRDLIRNKGKE